MLEVESLETAYGPVRALDGVSFTVPDGSITAVLGANGAGKTSLLRTISGVVRARAGRVLLEGRDIDRHPVQGDDAAERDHHVANRQSGAGGRLPRLHARKLQQLTPRANSETRRPTSS